MTTVRAHAVQARRAVRRASDQRQASQTITGIATWNPTTDVTIYQSASAR